MSPPKMGIGKVPIPDSPTAIRGSSPSMQDSHDEPGAGHHDDLVILYNRVRRLDGEVEEIRRRLDAQSTGIIEVKSPGGWSGKAPKGAAILIVLIVALTILRDEIGKLIAVMSHGK